MISICSGEGCEKSFMPSRWGNQRAQNQGWFLQKSGEVWCPAHVPDWVGEWRVKRDEKEDSLKVLEELKDLCEVFSQIVDGHQEFPNLLWEYSMGNEITVQNVYDAMTPEKKEVLHLLVGKTLDRPNFEGSSEDLMRASKFTDMEINVTRYVIAEAKKERRRGQ